jgi:hypothetical protein
LLVKSQPFKSAIYRLHGELIFMKKKQNSSQNSLSL